MSGVGTGIWDGMGVGSGSQVRGPSIWGGAIVGSGCSWDGASVGSVLSRLLGIRWIHHIHDPLVSILPVENLSQPLRCGRGKSDAHYSGTE